MYKIQDKDQNKPIEFSTVMHLSDENLRNYQESPSGKTDLSGIGYHFWVSFGEITLHVFSFFYVPLAMKILPF